MSKTIMTDVMVTVLRKFINLIQPMHLQLCIENNMYVMSSLLYMYKHDSQQIIEMLQSSGIDEETREILQADLRNISIAWDIIGLIHNVFRLLPKDKISQILTVERLEELMQKEHPTLYEVYIQYGERGRRWLQAEVENDLRPFFLGKKKEGE